MLKILAKVNVNERLKNMRINTSIASCNTCPRNQYGICSGITDILNQDEAFHSPTSVKLLAKVSLYFQGEGPVKTYILRQGWMLLIQVSEQGKRQVIRSVLLGDLLSFQTDIEKQFAYSAIAMQDSIVCYLPDLFKMCSQYPELALKLVWEEEREKVLTEHYMTNIAHRSAREKIAFMVLELYQRLTLRGLNKGFIIPLPLKQEDIADTLGLTTVHVNRTLHKLEQDNLISIHKHELNVLDCDKLVDIVGWDLMPAKICEISDFSGKV